ncbi:RNA polymerase sigma factor [Sphingobium sp. H39-3-25]|uniref:RNA polymerase sigma factor n=1 Tax=Sphingomonadales TaxID=204457 RepID=UPI0009FBF633|nr:RNA polymerase sigma factor [Novosphingobium naphthalenivorans]MDF0545207.1 RNA polymerase sigma factor [Sphingobium arseniciresistens]
MTNGAGRKPKDLKRPPEHDAAVPTGALQRLLDAFEADYGLLHQKLTVYLKSSEAAAEALHDTYIKLRKGPSVGDLQYPRAYLFRMAINLAKNRQRGEGRESSEDDLQLHSFPDSAPDPERAATATDEMQRALEALHRLPDQRREIFLARWRDEKSQAEIALEFGLHKRTVQKELTRAEQHLRVALHRPKN